MDALAAPEEIRAEQQDRARLPGAQQQAERTDAAAEFAGLYADDVWQDDEMSPTPYRDMRCGDRRMR